MKRFYPFSLSVVSLSVLFAGIIFAGTPEKNHLHRLNHATIGAHSGIFSGYTSGWSRDGLFGCYDDEIDDSFCLQYNRVDGLFVGYKKPRELYRRHGIFQIYGLAGIGLKSNRFQYQVAFERSFFPAYMQTSFGAEAYDLTYSEDEWLIPTMENSLAALLIHEDYHDFYRRIGYGGFFSQQFTRHARLKAGYYEEDHRNLFRKTDWALFGGRKSFRMNPAIEEATLRGLLSQFRIDTRNRYHSTRKGWLINMVAEYFPAKFNGTVDFERYILDVRRFQPISRGENINIRIRAGESAGVLPIQKYFDLGGISTLRAFDYKAFTGDRMILGNIEYHVNWDRLNWSPSIPILDEFNFIIFADAGAAWFREDMDFQDLTFRDLYSDAGIAFATSDGSMRLNIAKRLDRSVDAIRVTFRLSQPF